MKKIFKKALTIFTAFVLIGVTSTPINAVSKNTYQVEAVNNATELLDSLSNTQTVVACEDEVLGEMLDDKLITREDLNAELFDMSNDSVKELRKEGYSDSQIEVIKNYDGESDALQYISDSKAASPTLNPTLTFRYGLAGSDNTQKRVRIAYDIKWSSCPFFTFTDCFGIGWIAADKNSRELVTKTTSVVGESQIYTVDGLILKGTRKIKMDTETNGIVTAKPVIGSVEGGGYAKHMGGVIYVQTQLGSYNMKTIQIFVAYGHTVPSLTVAPSVSITFKKVSNSISFSVGSSQEMLIKSHSTFAYNSQREVVAVGS